MFGYNIRVSDYPKIRISCRIISGYPIDPDFGYLSDIRGRISGYFNPDSPSTSGNTTDWVDLQRLVDIFQEWCYHNLSVLVCEFTASTSSFLLYYTVPHSILFISINFNSLERDFT